MTRFFSFLKADQLNVLQIIHICLILALWLIFAPIMICWTYKIGKKKRAIIMQKRHIGLSLLSCSLCIIWIIIGLPIFIIQTHLDIFFDTKQSPLYIGATIAIPILYPILNYGVCYTILVRFFMLFFYHNWTDITLAPGSHWIIHCRKPSTKDREKEQLQLQQNNNNSSNTSYKTQQLPVPNMNTIPTSKSNINKPNNNSNNNNNNDHNNKSKDDFYDQIQNASKIVKSWFIRNRPKYGNVQRVLRKLYLCYLIAICAVIFVSVMATHSTNNQAFWRSFQHSVNFVLWLIPCLAIIILWSKTPKHIHDSFCFREEMKNLLIIMVITGIAYLTMSILTIFGRFVSLKYESLEFYMNIGNEICVIFQCLSTVYIQTLWIINRIEKQSLTLKCDFYNESLIEMMNESLIILPKTQLNLSASSYKATYSNSVPTTTLSPQFAVNINHQNGIEMPQITENVVHHKLSNDTINVNNNNNNNNNHHNNISDEFDIKQQPPELTPDSDQNRDKYDSQMFRILFDTLIINKLFDDFTKYLSSELLMECSFAFIEFTQFKLLIEHDVTLNVQSGYHSNSILSQSPYHDSYSFDSVNLPSSLPHSIPRSSIVHNRKYAKRRGTDRYRKIAKKLSEKYLESGAEFELPINKNTKKFVVNWVKNNCRYFKSIPRGHGDLSSNISSNYSSQSGDSSKYSSTGSLSDDLYHLFEHCRKEIYFLMAHSCDRYVKYAKYQRILS